MARNTAVKTLSVTAITAIMLIAAWHLGMKKKSASPPMIVAAKPVAPASETGLAGAVDLA